MKTANASRHAHLLLALLALGFVLNPAAADPPQPGKNDLAISLTANKVIAQPDGQEKLQPADRAFPGEVIQYDARYLNRSGAAIRNLQPTLPIPAGMAYVPESASPAPAQASLDGRHFEVIPLKRAVTLPTGEVQEREVPPTEYRALRWSVAEMPAGATATVVARARLLPATP